MKLPSIPYLAEAFLSVVRRFPLVMTAAAVGVVISMLLIEHENSESSDQYAKILMTCSLGLTLLLCASLICEKWKLNSPLSFVPHIIALGLLALYYFTLDLTEDFDNIVTPMRFAGLNLAAHLAVAFLPYLDESPVEDFWEYNKRLFGNFMVGAFYALVIFTGLSIAILAVNELFNLSIDGKIYGHLFVVIAGIFNTAYFLAHFPKRFDFTAEVAENQEVAFPASPYTTAFKNLTKFILIPITAIYFLILYAFSTKILVTWQLPEGWVGKLVLGFSVAGILTYLLNYLLVKYDDSALVKGFRRWFFYVLMPMVLLLFVAIGRRIDDYGVTEPRYVVAISGVWLLFVSLYFMLSKRDNIKFIPISLAVFSLLTVLGPLSAFKVSERNQIGRLKAVFEKNNMFKDGKVVASVDSLDKEDAEQIRGGIDYLRNNRHFEGIAPWFDLPTDSIPDWQVTSNIMQTLGIEATTADTKNCTIYFDRNTQKAIDIKGYDLFYQVNAYGKDRPASDFTGFTITEGAGGLQYYENGEKLDSFDLGPFLKMLEEKGMCNAGNKPDSLAFYEASAMSLHMKIQTDNVSFEKGANKKIREFNGQVLLRKKQ